jgi:Leucine-rich repeat (LRR) protein
MLSDLPRLRELDLSGNEISDAAIETVAKCQRLEKLNLSDTNLEVDPKNWAP